MVWLKQSRQAQPRDKRNQGPRLQILPPPTSEAAPVATPDPASSQALPQLKMLIDSGEFACGSRLPSERDLAARLGVGRPALREAIQSLNALGILESRRGSGTYVKSLKPQGLLFDPLSFTNSNLGVLDVLEVRKMIEPHAAALAASRAGETHLRDIAQAQQALESPATPPARLDELAWALQAAIVRGAQNHLLWLLYQTLEPLLAAHPALSPDLTGEPYRLRRELSVVVQAVCRHQPDEAERAMLEHLDNLGLRYISGQGAAH